MVNLILSTLAAQALPDSVSALYELRTVVLATQAAPNPVWRITARSWDTVWSQEAFGIKPLPVDTTRFRFRVPPDSMTASSGGESPFLVEAYERGLPSYGIRRNGEWAICRPLGIEYGTDGYCRKVSVYVEAHGGWREPRLTPRAKTSLLGTFGLYESQWLAPSENRPMHKFDGPWIKIVSQGHGTYWLDHDLDIIGPYGIADRLSPSAKSVIAEIVEGKWNKPPKRGTRTDSQ